MLHVVFLMMLYSFFCVGFNSLYVILFAYIVSLIVLYGLFVSEFEPIQMVQKSLALGCFVKQKRK